MIGKPQFQLLSYLIDDSGQEVPISTLADHLEWSDGHTSRIVSELETKGFIRTTKTGRQKLVSLAEIGPVEQLETLIIEYSHVDFPQLIAGSGLQLLYYLNHGRTATELAEVSGISRATVYRRLEDLQEVGIVGKSDSHYQINEPFSALSSIARGMAHQEHRTEAGRYAENVSILWETHEKYLFACDGEIRNDTFFLTGPSLFEEFGIPLLTRSRRHYLRSDRSTSITPAELVCHTLLIDDASRYRTYCLLLITKESIGREALSECTEQYDPEADIDLSKIIEELVEYLETEGSRTSDQLPSWNEFKSTAADYEIDL